MKKYLRYLNLILFIFIFSSISFAKEKEKIFTFDFNKLKSSSYISTTSLSGLYLPLPDGQKVPINRKEIEYRKNGFTWYGTIRDYPDSLVVITVEDGVAYGSIRIDDKEYIIQPFSINENKYKIQEFLREDFLPFGDDFIPAKPKNISTQDIKPTANQLEDGSQVDVLLLYTAEMENVYGSGVKTKLRNFVDLGNVVLKNSQINTKLNIVGIEKFDTPDTNENVDIYTSIENLSQSSSVKNLRDKYNADIVTLFRVFKGGRICGIGYTPIGLPDNLSSNVATYASLYDISAYNVVNVGSYGYYYCSEFTYIHEVGHNFGCQHDRDHANGGGAYSYSYGYDIPGIFATVMSYDSPTIEYFSNPNIYYNGYQIGKPEGDPEEADNAKTINKTRLLVANYRIRSTGQNLDPYITVYPSQINFGRVALNITVSETIKVTNIGNEILNINSISLSGSSEFSIENSCLGKSLSMGDSCLIKVYFSPKTEGVKQATIQINSNASNSIVQVSIKGEGRSPIPPTIVVSKKFINFGKIENKSSAIETIYLENISSDNNLNISINASFSSDFEIVNKCGNTIEPLSKCSVTIIFTPKTIGIKKYTFYINSNDPQNPQVEINVLGESIPKPGKLIIEPEEINFGKVYIGEEKSLDVTLKNIGDLDLKILNIYTNGSTFKVNNSCSLLKSNETCLINVTFKPWKVGIANGMLFIKTDTESKMISVSGEGVEKVGPSIFIKDNKIDFGVVNVGEQAKRSVVIENKGTDDLIISSLSVDNPSFSISNACKIVAPKNSCSVDIIFSPKKEGNFEGKLIINSNDLQNPTYYIDLQGKGKLLKKPVISISKKKINFGNVFSGEIYKEVLEIKNIGNAPLSIKEIYSDLSSVSINSSCENIQPNGLCLLEIVLTPEELGNFSGYLYIKTDDPTDPNISIPILYTVKEKPKPIIEYIPSEISFNEIYIGDFEEKTITLKNIGNARLILNKIYTDDDNFSVKSICKYIEPNNSCTISILFVPKVEGDIEGNLIFETNIGKFHINLKGVALKKEAILRLENQILDFGEIFVGDKKEIDIVIENIGNAPLEIQNISLQGDKYFSIKYNCSILQPKTKCKITVVFAPTEEGTFSGEIYIKNNSENKPNAIIQIKGYSLEKPVPDIYIEKNTLNFGNVEIGNQKEINFVIYNKGKEKLVIQDFILESTSFIITNTCEVINPQSKCTLSLIFKPEEIGDITSVLYIYSNDPDTSIVKVELKGQGLEKKEAFINVSQEDINFGYVIVDETKTKRLYIQNIGNDILEFKSVTLVDQNNFFIKNNCSQRLLPNEECYVDISFSPKREGQIESILKIESTATNIPILNINLAGTGIYISQDEADIDNDGEVSNKDLEEAVNIIVNEESSIILDLNNDNKVDISDIILLLRKIRGL